MDEVRIFIGKNQYMVRIDVENFDLQQAHSYVKSYCQYYGLDFYDGIKQVMAYESYLKNIGNRQIKLNEYEQKKIETPVLMSDFMRLNK